MPCFFTIVGESCPPRSRGGGPRMGAGGANTWYRTPPVSFADSPLLKAGAKGAAQICYVVGGALPRPYRALQYCTPLVGEGLCPSRRFCKNRIGEGNMQMRARKPCPPRLRGGCPDRGGGSNTLYRTPPVTALRRCQPPLKSGGRGYGADFWVSGRGTAPPLQKIAISASSL